MNKDQAIHVVEKHLGKNQPEGYRLQVYPGTAHQEGELWIIGVGPDKKDVRRYDYYDVLARVQREIDDEEADVNISLMPPPSGTVDPR